MSVFKRKKSRKRDQNFVVFEDEGASLPTPIIPHRHEHLSVSATGQRSVTSRIFGLLQSPKKWKRSRSSPVDTNDTQIPRLIPLDDPDIDFLNFAEFDLQDVGYEPVVSLVDAQDEDDIDTGPSKKKRARTAGDHPLREWAEHDRDRDLQEVLRLEGRGDYSGRLCFGCGVLPAIYRCVDCERVEMFCAKCLVSDHVTAPLHCIKRWNGSFFERATLKSLGLRVQLGHMTGEKCVNPRKAPGDSFTVVHTNGIHDISLDFCDCETAKPSSVQLLRHFWFPSTTVYPKSAATIRVLKQFHLLAFEAKCSPYEFYNSLARSTDNTGLHDGKDRYDEFMRMYREWCNLTLVKRAARGHDSKGVKETGPGECALLCPACPQPGKNLPPDWENAPCIKRWLYTLFIAIDANFRLARKHISSDERDPCLSDGWTFFVKKSLYKEHLKAHWDLPQEKSTCVNHDAVNNADKEVKGRSVTGVGTADCARHGMKRPNGLGDLQKGERYLNMDYIVFSSLRGTSVKIVVFSYDIGCQWHKNIWERTRILPPDLRLSPSVEETTFLVPKFHLPAHVQQCQTKHSFNLTKNVARTDGETPERGWSVSNALATSTREMGPGNRLQVLDDHYNDGNWKKITSLGAAFLKKIKEAVPMATSRFLEFREFEKVLPKEDISEWKVQVEAWEEDASKPNPFEPRVKCITEQAIRLKLAQEAAADASQSQKSVMSDELDSGMHPTIFIAQGLELEEQQLRLAQELRSLGGHPTANQLRILQESANKLQRRLTAWTEWQKMYMPFTSVLRNWAISKAGAEAAPPKVHEVKLWLPSALQPSDLCDTKLRVYEWRLREAQAHSALHQIRQSYRLKSHVVKHKKRFLRGVAANTKSNTLIQKVQDKINKEALKYRTAYAALTALSPLIEDKYTENWLASLKPLREEDVRGMSEGLEGESEGKRSISWIWRAEGVSSVGQNEQLHEALRIEWCRSRARAMRWSEEVDLLEEEMRRIVAFLEWQSTWWKQRGDGLANIDEGTKEGLVAYRKRQAALRLSLRDRFALMWKDVPQFIQEGRASRENVDSVASGSGLGMLLEDDEDADDNL